MALAQASGWFYRQRTPDEDLYLTSLPKAMAPTFKTQTSKPHHDVDGEDERRPFGDPEVLVLDDDPAVLRALDRLLTDRGYKVSTYLEPNVFFRAGPPPVPACLILDYQLGNGVTGVEVHAELQRLGWNLPTVFVTAHWSVPLVVQVMRKGADGFLTKPYNPDELIEAVAQALDHARVEQREGLLAADARARAASLTARELEIVRLITAGLLNKEIADKLNIALVTVKVHRGHAMRKLGAGNSAELGRIIECAGLVS